MRFDPSSLSVAILSGDVRHAALDKNTLLRMRFQDVRAFQSLQQSQGHLESGNASIALIDSALADMDGIACLRQLAKGRRTSVKALVMVTSESQQEYVMDAVSAGCSGYVIRPYSLETMEKHIRAAWNSLSPGEIEEEMLQSAQDALRRQDFDAAISEFEEMVSEENEALKYFNLGMDYLREKKYGKAILSFNKAVALNELYAEAHRGLAYAHKGKGDDSAYQEHLRRAADLFALQDKLAELKEVFVEILRDDPEAVNPYNTLGVKLRRSGDYLGALHAYNQALSVTPEDENLHYNIAKAHIYAGDTDRALDHLRQALVLKPDFSEAGQLARRLEHGESAGADPKDATPARASAGGLLLD
ncbi:Chemotaxis protein CheY [Fundidesulfovibrio magnetotacticus]|uniref:Chemotaxis protein CheY n=1 Tax=Fundidesulfovibrio magnetotacticus TaxID=2730080 RepID=A0A6V8LYC6_9BACT|nr:tetratricopeptide repeat protein [Fundidesulfovibrio magnetotacticus]GFK95039.1 Chemotaxis protein CheY [Fundidesulfovibrio magnetotacticus]